MPQKVYLLILKFGVYLSLFSVFLVFKSLLFPFITSKQISFNILIEILFIFWLGLILQYPEYRPKKSHVTTGLIVFFAVLVIAGIFGVDFNLSFWGDVERMLGVFHLLHFLVFYLIIITAFRNWQEWKPLLILSIIIASIVSMLGIKEGNEAYSTIGNTAYVSGYLIFNIYFSLLLFFKEKNRWVGLLYFIPMPFILLEFQLASTSGAFVGLASSVVLLFFLYGILAKNKKVKFGTLGATILLVAILGFAYTNKDSSFVVNNPILSPIRGVSLDKNTFQTRLISWRAAWLDFGEHPILGNGHGNYAITFDKHFDPKFLSHTSSETYFDRAHNNLIDIATTSGLLGLAAYLSIFIALAYYLINGYRKEKLSIHEFVIISSLITAYFIQNLAVFDSLVTYMGLMITLGYAHWAYWRDEEFEYTRDKKYTDKQIYTLAGAGLLVLLIMFQYNYKSLQMLTLTIQGHMAFQQGQIETAFKVFKEAHAYNSVLERDSRTSMIRLFLNNPSGFQSLAADKRNEMLEYNIDIARKNLAYNENDSMNQMVLAQILNLTANYNKDNPEKFAFYSDQAMEAINKSIEASPGRVPVYYQKAQVHISRNEHDLAIETLKTAVNLNENFSQSHCHLGRTHQFYGNMDESWEYVDKCIDLNGTNNLSPASYIQGTLIPYYKEKDDTGRLIDLYIRLSGLENKKYEHLIELAKLYEKDGQIDKAIEAADKAITVSPSIKEYAEEYKSQLTR